MKKIVTSVGMIVFVAAIVAGGTGAFFSDTETSTGNVFTAGALDLTVDSEAHYNGLICVEDTNPQTPIGTGTWQVPVGGQQVGPSHYPQPGTPCVGTWTATDLGAQTFFNYTDVKPGDEGENTISLHINNNPAWACVDVDVTKNDDVSSNEPELSAGDSPNSASPFDGELAQNIKFAAWLDQGNTLGWQGKGQDVGEGDNVWQGPTAEPLLFSNQSGPASDVLSGKSYTLAAPNVNGGVPMAPNQTNYIGLAWCAGTQAIVGSDITCDGSTLGNIVQTDSMEANIAFRVEQSRNNPNFTCARNAPVLQGWVENGVRTGGDASIVADDTAPAGGANALKLLTINDVDSRVRYSFDIADINLSAFTGFSYDSKQVSAADLVNGNASFRLLVDLDGNLLTVGDVKDVTYEPYYNILPHNALNDASIVPGTWQNWAATMADGKFWAGGVTTVLGPSEGAGGAYATNFTMQQLLDAYPSAKILEINIGMGTYNVNQVIHVDNLVFNGVTLGFE
jgi:predicted ribosomally synthesized peptide with SipW-like signal peptide